MKATDGTSASTADAAAAADDDMNDFIINAPKVELHAHLNGCIRESTLFELAQERSVTLSDHHFAAPSTTASSPLSDHSHSIMYNVRPRSLQDCFDMFAEIPKCVNDLKSLRRITLEALADFASHHVVYLELRSTPKQLLRNTGGESELADKRTYCLVVLEAMRDFEQKEHERYTRETAAAAAAVSQPKNQSRLPMISRFLVAIDRSQSVEDADEHVELAKSLRHDYGDRVAGVDLGGNPTKNHFLDFRPAFETARAAGLKITLHCAEVPCNEMDEGTATAYQEAKSVLEFGPDRLGHALLLPPSLQFLLKEKKIPVESCPTSNVMTLELAKHCSGSLLEGLWKHPQLQTWLETKHPISIGTDDPGVFDTNPTKELMLLQKTFSVPRATLKRILLESMDHAFCNDETRRQIQTQMRERLM